MENRKGIDFLNWLVKIQSIHYTNIEAVDKAIIIVNNKNIQL